MRTNPRATGRSSRPGRVLLGMILTAALAGTLAACSGSGTPAANTATTRPPAVAPRATTPAAASTTPAPAGTGLSGKWSGMYSGAYQGTFTLNWQQSGTKLSGTIQLSNPPGTLSINGQVTGGSIQFGTVGSTAITYSGSVSGSTMSGQYQVQGSAGGPWSATQS